MATFLIILNIESFSFFVQLRFQLNFSYFYKNVLEAKFQFFLSIMKRAIIRTPQSLYTPT